jgi:phospholipid transport system substrate-binding protein
MIHQRQKTSRYAGSILAVIFLFSVSSGAQEGAEDAEAAPQVVIENAATTMSDKLIGRKDYYESNLGELYVMINEVLLPHFDTRYSGRLVLGKHWKAATEDQRSSFIDAFYQFLMRSYAKGLLGFDQDKIEFLPFQGEVDGKRVVVKTVMHLDDGSEVPVNYSLRRSDAGWKVYDVRIEGVSYIQNYRNQFNAEISANGVNSVIDRLRAEVADEAELVAQ